MSFTAQIRLATINDAKALAAAGSALFLQSYDGLIADHEMAIYVADHFNETLQRSELSNPEMATLLVECNNKIAGFAQLSRNPVPIEGCNGEVELRRIYLAKDWHGKGVAQKLMKKVADAARSFSAQAIWLAVWEENLRAIAFYRKAGFEPVGALEFRVGTLVQNDVIMRAPVGEM